MHHNNPPHIVLLEVFFTWVLTFLSFVSQVLPIFQLVAVILAIIVSLNALGVFKFINKMINKWKK